MARTDSIIRHLMLGAAERRQVRDFVTTHPSMRGLVERFVAGETREEATANVMRLNAAGVTGSLDHLGEAVETAAQAVAEAEEYLALVETIALLRLDASVSVKLTALGLVIDPALCERHLERIAERAAERGNFVRVDMESSKFTGDTLRIVYRVFERHRNVGVVLQSCLYRTAADVEVAIAHQMRARLCKGAYLEPSRVAFSQKKDVDSNYGQLMERLLDSGTSPALATHDERLINRAMAYARLHDIEPGRFEFQMLYGVRRDLQAGLVAGGYGVRVYVPYGKAWYAYLTRRLAERPANVLFVVGSLLRERNTGIGRVA
ncbi:MAG: proline dehydrogenase family protein [Chloroflexi bacterium]|nr:proline dehydrogenase family protein [Chloroflexota bacterium]